MYKLFLCLRYLRRRHIAFIAIIGVALCVAMVLIVISVMNGFLAKVEQAAKGMLGEVIMDATTGGLGHYDEFIDDMKLQIPEVEAATPVIYSYGLLRSGPEFTQPVRLVGIRLPESTRVTRFDEGLYPPEKKAKPNFDLPPALAQILVENAEIYRKSAERFDAEIRQAQAQLQAEQEKPRDQQDPRKVEQIRATINEYVRQVSLDRQMVYRPKQPGIILGTDIVNRRDKKTGEVVRPLPVGATVMLAMLPIGRGRISASAQPFDRPFTLVGDSRVGVYQIDSINVYVDFNELQTLMDMGEQEDMDSGWKDPARCSQVQIKVRGGTDERRLIEITGRIQALWDQYVVRYPLLNGAGVEIQTWRQKQKGFIDPIESQRTLVVIMFGVISLVAVVLVFAIFYMMVIQKTKDIGVIKSIGGSQRGVAGIFLFYGAAIGVVGSIIGVITGVLFVHYINNIHDWVASTFGWVVFDRQAYMFDKIPNQVEPAVVVSVVIGAILAGLVGAIAPAIRAARMEPVEALRYE